MWLLDVWFHKHDDDGAAACARIPLKQSCADRMLAAKSLICFTGGSSRTNAATWSGGSRQTCSLVSPQLSAPALPLTLYLTDLMKLSAAQGKLGWLKSAHFYRQVRCLGTERWISLLWPKRPNFLDISSYFRAKFGLEQQQLEMSSSWTGGCRWFRCVLRLNTLLLALVCEGSFQETCMPGRLTQQETLISDSKTLANKLA